MNIMNTIDPWVIVALVAAFISLIGVIGTLIYMATQSRQTTTQMRSQMYADLVDKDREIAKYFIDHPKIAGVVYGKGNLLYGEKDEDAKEIWSTILVADFYENLFIQKYFKTIHKKLWPHWEEDIVKGWVSSKAYSSPHWPKLKELYWSEFVKKCEEIEEGKKKAQA